MIIEENKKNVKPVYSNKSGAIDLAVWSNERLVDGEKKVFHSVTITRNYKDKDGNWQQTNTLGQYDLLNVSKLLSKAHEILNMKESFSSDFGESQL